MDKEIERFGVLVDKWRLKRVEKITIEDVKNLTSLLMWAVDLGMEKKDSYYKYFAEKLLHIAVWYLKAALYGYNNIVIGIFLALRRGDIDFSSVSDELSKYVPYRKYFEDMYSAILALSDILGYRIPEDLRRCMDTFMVLYNASVYASGKDEFMSMVKLAVRGTPFESSTQVGSFPFVKIRIDRPSLWKLPYPYAFDYRFLLHLPLLYGAYALLPFDAFMYFLQGLIVPSLPFVASRGLFLFAWRLLKVFKKDDEKIQMYLTGAAALSLAVASFINNLYLYMLAGYLLFWFLEGIYVWLKRRYALYPLFMMHDAVVRSLLSSFLFVVVAFLINSLRVFDALKSILSFTLGIQ